MTKLQATAPLETSMDTAIIDELEQLTASLEQAQSEEEYEKAAEIQGRIASLCRQLETLPVEQLQAQRQRIENLYARLSEGFANAESVHGEIKNEILGFKKKAAGINAYRNASRRRRW